MENNLSSERSRYLLQHASNPVAWQPWGESAFESAREAGKPLLVSIGYSSCHWCHVMAHESFENDTVADIINEHFVAIKVDKEEYPDIDGFYMSFQSKLAGNGGWPLNVFVNPDGAPFYGLTYRDPEGFASLLQYVADEYKKNQTIQDQKIGTSFNERLVDPGELSTLLSTVKFPSPSSKSGPQFPQGLYLSLAWERENKTMVAAELENIVTKGLFDHIEGGWFRYSVDPAWKIPHFEKMLYDQAVLLSLCADVYVGNEEICGYAISGAAAWLREQMLLPNGLYGSATDADTEEGEGSYYVIDEPGSTEEVELFRIVECGRHEGSYLPWIDLVRLTSPGAQEIVAARKKARTGKITPRLDGKAVFSWNAYLAYALGRCGAATGDDGILAQAADLRRAVEAAAEDEIHHVYYDDGSTKGNGYLEDWASWLLLTTAAEDRDIDGALKLVDEIDRRFYHDGRLWHTGEMRFENQNLWQDTPFPSGGSLLLLALTRLELTDHRLYRALFTNIAEVASDHPEYFSNWLRGFFAAI